MNPTNQLVTTSSTNLSAVINNSNIKVYVRFRPICAEKSETPIDYEFNTNEIVLRKTNHQARGYYFDGIFGDQSEQQDLSEVIIDPFIQQVIEGFNCTVLAYGQTGTGKTYTIEGDYLNDLEDKSKKSESSLIELLPNKAGLVPRAFYKLFNLLKPEDQFKVSVIEIYNEEVYDLLSDNSDSLRIYECQKGVTFNNLKEFIIKNANDLDTILQKSNSKRQFASTLMNKRSSRSHVIYSFVHHRKETLKNNQVVEKIGKLNLVDLAGSECAKRTGCQDLRALEASSINRSLLTLTRVIDALVKNQKYIPFRSSNLTRILQDTLGGNSKTTLIATLSPALIDFEDTINTLLFASTVKQVKNNACANVKVIQNNYLEERFKELEENLILEQNKHEEELALLRSQIEELKQSYELKLKSKEDKLEDIENKLETKQDEIQSLKRKISKLCDELVNSDAIVQNNLQHKENDIQPASKKRRSTKPLSNSTNNKIQDKATEDLAKILKNDVNFLFKEHNLITRKVNRVKALITSQESSLKELFEKNNKKKELICSNQLEENLSSFLNQMFNIAIQDEFDLFFEYLTSTINSELPENKVHDLEEKFSEFSKYVYEKLEFVKETADNTVNSNKEELEKKTKLINEIDEITEELNKEIKEFVKIAKKSKDKVKDMKNAIPV